MKDETVLRFARAGAGLRLNELRSEVVGILKVFPDMEFPAIATASPATAATASTGALEEILDATVRKPRRKQRMSASAPKRHMSRKARKAISEAQKARWAKQRAKAN